MYKRKYGGGYGMRKRPKYNVGKYLTTAAKIGWNAYNSYQDYRRKRSPPETGVTTQYDKTTQYIKKSMPKRKKRQWKRFVQKVQAVNSKSLGTNTIVFNKSISTAVTATVQGFICAALYGFTGDSDASNFTGMRDIYTIATNDSRIGQPGSGNRTGKFTFGSACIDMTMRNAGTVTLEVDVYELMFGSDLQTNGNPISTFGQADAATPRPPTGVVTGTSIAFNSRGATPFDFPYAIGADKMKILKKRKYLLGAGQAATLQYRDPRNYVVNPVQMDLVGIGHYAKRMQTRIFVFVAKTLIGEAADGTLFIGTTRKYTYEVQAYQTPADSYNIT